MPAMRGIYDRLNDETTFSSGSPLGKRGGELASFTMRIGNYRHIRRAFGEDIALEVLDRLVNRVNQVLRGDGVAAPAAYGQIMVRMTGLGSMQSGAATGVSGSWLWALCTTMSTFPVRIGSATIFPLVWASWDRRPDGLAAEVAGPADPWHVDELAPVCEASADEKAGWAERYRTDMALAAEILSVITPAGVSKSGGGAADDLRFLLLLWQPIHDARHPERVLYQEALLRFVDRHGVWNAPSQSLLALERLGLVSLLDQHIVSRVIDRLEGDSGVRLGVNISAKSARCDLWWQEVMARLRAAPQVARRLTVEITETAAMPDMTSAVRFVDGVKRLGVRVALDDFGVGFTSIRQIMALKPDVVKIDGFFMREADLSGRGREVFNHLVRLTASFGATVVVEGVETAGQADLALEAGIHWQQGYFWARPAVSQTWKSEGDGPLASASEPSDYLPIEARPASSAQVARL